MRTFLMLMAVSLVAGGVFGGVLAVADRGLLPLEAEIASIMVAFAAFGAILYACLRWWRMLDEAAQEAHKWAWWWGGSAGMLVGLIGLLLLQSLQARGRMSAWGEGESVGETLYHGAVAILLFQVAGYAVAWAFWWLRHR